MGDWGWFGFGGYLGDVILVGIRIIIGWLVLNELTVGSRSNFRVRTGIRLIFPVFACFDLTSSGALFYILYCNGIRKYTNVTVTIFIIVIIIVLIVLIVVLNR